MAEALAGLGVAASVIAVVQLGTAVISGCSAYGTTYKNASKDMNQLRDEVARLVPVLSAIHKLIKDEETKMTAQLPTLIAAFNTPYDRQSSDTSVENQVELEDGRTDSTPNSRTGRHAMVNSLWKKLKTKDRSYSVETKSGRTDVDNVLEGKDGE
ncbi:hypothetical protein JB92DRAFT_991938 [Gautieria morchelliformis]|nr:hypothetical protein JB92DRAFT_991938 [Gautieria morchelliformis]